MRKSVIGFGIFAGLLIFLWFTLRVTGVLQFYRMPGISMEPTLPVGSRFIVTNLKKTKRNDIVAYTRIANESDGLKPGTKATFLHRLIAFEGENVEIRNGLAYVNGHLVDDSTKLKFSYIANAKDVSKIMDSLGLNPDDPANADNFYSIDAERANVQLSYNDYKKLNSSIALTRNFNDRGVEVLLYGNDTSKSWTIHNYGPLHIPKGYFFVLGDNREFSADSRYNGPIAVKNIKGTLLTAY